MDTPVIAATCGLAGLSALAAFVAYRRLAGTGERASCLALIVFVIGWLALLAALITGAFLIVGRGG